ncbi:MAG: 50S ribosomal protein L25/general stress protein Ctc [Paludibacteraceae bacterium]|jgi:large subunit ribosomal protein L25|nr:50S ribosomal protein L25/general stress protein Ctc [Paludibacteraceae bacterium]MBQ2065279.1 50S ribosomal protein L25/general stress protein Ctc [Paludibacteraceae bacterium]MBQ5524541.1 50S ribosomal protein L25/general stress protein Ctc [Paludibacteraceae bacterium]
MKTFELSGSVRSELGQKASAALRKQDLIPCVLYGCKKENTNFTVSKSAVRKLIYSPEVFEVKLTIDNKVCSAVIKEIQFHPVSDNILHIDFLEVDDKKPIVFKVPVKTEGLAVGVKAGGKLSLEMKRMKVKGLCKNIPECVTVNVENLEVGKSIKAGELSFPNIEIVDNKESLVVCVKSTRAAKAAAEAAK